MKCESRPSSADWIFQIKVYSSAYRLRNKSRETCLRLWTITSSSSGIHSFNHAADDGRKFMICFTSCSIFSTEWMTVVWWSPLEMSGNFRITLLSQTFAQVHRHRRQQELPQHRAGFQRRHIYLVVLRRLSESAILKPPAQRFDYLIHAASLRPASSSKARPAAKPSPAERISQPPASRMLCLLCFARQSATSSGRSIICDSALRFTIKFLFPNPGARCRN